MYTPSESWGVWVGAVGQIATAIAIIRFTNKSSKASATKTLNDMFNALNSMMASSPAYGIPGSKLRGPVIDPHTDALVFSYLNCILSFFEMRKQGLVSADEEDAIFRNAAAFLAEVDADTMTRYLSRGYTKTFCARLHSALANRPH